MDDYQRRREEKQPLELPSAGSTFKRPPGHFAGKLIMDAGLRGYRVGGAQVSEKHCGFVVNIGGATAADVNALIEKCGGKEPFTRRLDTYFLMRNGINGGIWGCSKSRTNRDF